MGDVVVSFYSILVRLKEVNKLGGMLHFEMVCVKPEFALADVEVVDGCAGDVWVVWVLHLGVLLKYIWVWFVKYQPKILIIADVNEPLF